MGRLIAHTRFGILGWQVLSLGVLALAWEAAVRLGIADPLFVPAPGAVALADLRAKLWDQVREESLKAMGGRW